MNDLQKYFFENNDSMLYKWMHYFEIYDRHFSKYRGTEVNILEFGVFQGGSLKMWRDYFGPKANIYGVDINPHCKSLEDDRIKIFIGDQEDRASLREIAKQIPRIDILIDDGGHRMDQQVNTFEELFPLISENGVYLCEDLHSSYWKRFGGGYKKKGTFIEYSKHLIDKVNAWHSETPRLTVTDFTKSAASMHYYDSILVIEKRALSAPTESKTGVAKIPDYSPQRTFPERVRRWAKEQVRRMQSP